MITENIREIFHKHKLTYGRMISGSKSCPAGQVCVFNANLVTKNRGKIWFGDLNITKEAKKLKKIAEEIGEVLYVLREGDCRFGTENDPIEVVIGRAVWDTTKE